MQQKMKGIIYQDITPEERARELKPVKVTITYGWGIEQERSAGSLAVSKSKKKDNPCYTQLTPLLPF